MTPACVLDVAHTSCDRASEGAGMRCGLADGKFHGEETSACLIPSTQVAEIPVSPSAEAKHGANYRGRFDTLSFLPGREVMW